MENRSRHPPLMRSDGEILTVSECPIPPYEFPVDGSDQKFREESESSLRNGVSDKIRTGIRVQGISEKWQERSKDSKRGKKEETSLAGGGELRDHTTRPMDGLVMKDKETVREETEVWLKAMAKVKEGSRTRKTALSREWDGPRRRTRSIEDLRARLHDRTRSVEYEGPEQWHRVEPKQTARPVLMARARSTEGEGLFKTAGSRGTDGMGHGERADWREGVGTRLTRERSESKEEEGGSLKDRARSKHDWGRQKGRSEPTERLGGGLREGEGRLYPMLPGELWELGPETTKRPLPPASCPRVQVRVVFLKLGEIDTMREQYSADVFLQARWRDPSLDGQEGKTSSSKVLSNRWNPRLKIINTMGEVKESVWQDVTFDLQGHAFILDRRRLIANFSESLELENFPLDIQYLSIHVASELADTELALVEDEEEPSFINMENFVDAQEWKLRDLVAVRPRLVVRELSSVQHRVPCLLVQCVAFRRAGFFLWNILCVMTLISSLAFCTWTVSPGMPQNRLQLSFTLMLTGVAFKFVATACLPKIPYLTYLDRFVLGSMLFLFLVCLWHAVVTQFAHSPELQAAMDKWAFFAFLILYVLANVVFLVVVYVKSYMAKKSLYEEERKYQERLRKAMGEAYAARCHSYVRRRRIEFPPPLVRSRTEV